MLLDPKWVRFSARLSSAVLLKAGLIYAGYCLGSSLDRKLHSEPWFMFLGVVCGVGLGLWWILFVANRAK